MKEKLRTIMRYAGWIVPALVAIYMLSPGQAELRTILLLIAIECIAVGMSSLALWAFTRIEFTEDHVNRNIGYIFLGVHICTGLSVLGVYIAQFSN